MRIRKLGLLLVASSLAGLAVTACSKTVSEQPGSMMQSQGMPGPAMTGFFGADAPLLQQGGEDEAGLLYVNPTADWSQYTKLLLEPVQFWDSSASKVSLSDQYMLTGYMYDKFQEQLGKNYTLVDQGGPGVIVIQSALVNATTATPVLRSISVVVPQARILNGLQSLVSDSYVFVGSAEGMLKAYDAQTGQLLIAAADKQAGGLALSTAAQWQWGDAKNAMDYWAQKTDARLMKMQGRQIAQ